MNGSSGCVKDAFAEGPRRARDAPPQSFLEEGAAREPLQRSDRVTVPATWLAGSSYSTKYARTLMIRMVQPARPTPSAKLIIAVDVDDPIAMPAHAAAIGLSSEWPSASVFAASTGFVQILRNLAEADGSAGPNLRIGGNTADATWWDPHHARSKNESCAASFSGKVCVTYAAGPHDIADHLAAVLAPGVGGSLIYDLNMVQNSSSTWAAEMVKGIEASAARVVGGAEAVLGYEIGNEPDLYFENGVRAPTYGPDLFLHEFRSLYLPAVRRASGRNASLPLIQGGTLCCKPSFMSRLPEIIGSMGGARVLTTWSQHGYGLAQPKRGQPGARPTLWALLENTAVTDRIEHYIRPSAVAAHANGVTFVVGETNSISASGEPGVSDTQAAALWGVDWICRLIQINATRVNFHGGIGAPYSWIIGFRDTEHRSPIVQPIYMAMLAMARALRGGATPVRLVRLPGSNASDLVVVHAFAVRPDASSAHVAVALHSTRSDTRNLTRAVRVLVVHKAANDTQPTRVQVFLGQKGSTAGSSHHTVANSEAHVAWLRAPSVNATKGLTWGSPLGNITFDATPDGSPIGTFRPQVVFPCEDGSYEVVVPPASFALLEVLSWA